MIIARFPLLSLLLLFVLLPVQAQTSLWKISKDGDAFYLGGTVHLLRPTDLPLPSQFDQVFVSIDQLILETDPQALQQADMQTVQQQLLFYPANEQLSQHLQAGTRQQLSTFLQSQGLSLEAVNQLRPGTLAAQLTVLQAQKAGFSEQGVDAMFYQKAVQQQKKLGYLESPRFQLELIAKLGQGQEDQFITLMLAESDQAVSQLQNIIVAWREGNIAELNQLVVEQLKSQDEASYQQLFVARNQAWLPQLMALFGNQQTELVLVGAGHLAGEQGLLQQLSLAGYQVEQIN